MTPQIIEIVKNLEIEIKEVKNLENLKIIKAKYLSKSDFLNELKDSIRKENDNNEKVNIGKKIKEYLENVNNILITKKEELINDFFVQESENILLKKDNNIVLEDKKGFIHPLTNISFRIQDFFDKLNYSFLHGFEVEKEKYNFDFLNMPLNHPAREMQDTFYLEEEKYLLRTHSTNMTVRNLEKKPKGKTKFYSIGSVFRNDDNDATHSFQFHQVDIYDSGEKASLIMLKTILDEFVNFIFEKKLKTRYRPSFFPFTEPSYELDITCPACNEQGCSLCKGSKWIEILGSGLINNNVFDNVGLNHKKMRCFAAGVGLERVAMIKWKINDIRNFYLNDLKFLKGYKG